MLPHKIRSLALLKNTLKQHSASSLKLSQPQWTLFKRMEYADRPNNRAEIVDFSEQARKSKQCAQNIIEIQAENFTESSLTIAIDSKLPHLQ